MTKDTPPRTRARSAVLLSGLLLLALASLAYPPGAARQPVVVNGTAQTDRELYLAVVTRLGRGEAYYDAMGAELRARDFPTGSVFNWRTPFHLTAMAAAPWYVWRGVLTVLLIGCFATTMATTGLRGLPQWTMGLILVGVLVLQSAWDAVYSGEVWAGALVAVSLLLYRGDRSGWAAVAGVLALVFRELAAPYCVTCAGLALARRQWRELGLWAAGAVAYAAYFWWHAVEVHAHHLPQDIVHGASWLQFGGLPFLQSTVAKMGWLSYTPVQILALGVVLIVAGVLNPRAPLHLRAASAAYVGFFLAFGLPFNDYWGFVASLLWATTCGYGMELVQRAVQGVTGPGAT